MRDTNLVNALRLKCGGGKKMERDVIGAMRTAFEQSADRIVAAEEYALVLKKEIEKLRAQNEQLREAKPFQASQKQWQNNGGDRMDDLISRQAAIDAIVNTPSGVQNKNIPLVNQYDGATFRQIEILGIIEALPSAQPATNCSEIPNGSDDTISKGVPFKRIVALMEADRDGRLVVLPCKVGDRLYEVTGRKTISVYEVRAIRVELFGLFIEWDIVEGFAWQSLAGINAGEIGKTVFLTREEAEKALEAMKDE